MYIKRTQELFISARSDVEAKRLASMRCGGGDWRVVSADVTERRGTLRTVRVTTERGESEVE